MLGLAVYPLSSSAAVRARVTVRLASNSSAPSVVARAKSSAVSIYSSPTSTHPYEVLQSNAYSGAPLAFLVTNVSLWPNWIRAYLPNRPNQSEGWIRVSEVTLASDPYVVRVHLVEHKLVVSELGRVIVSAPIGVGRSVLPTPTGTYYIVDLFKQPDPTGAYGPFAFGLSAFSDVLQSFGGGPGEIGLHGTDEPSSVGASVSHGCIRVTDNTITMLAKLLPLGTPVIISD